ncbi:hypothetical protein HMPREF3197_00536 [Klebsiella pneumoniae]|nr:hypothetical protein HMPREF3197_00536 [Klebsiella pneumoniae]
MYFYSVLPLNASPNLRLSREKHVTRRRVSMNVYPFIDDRLYAFR